MQSSKLIFDVTLGYLRCLEKQILECDNFQTVMNPKNDAFNDPHLLMSAVKKARIDFKQDHIDFYRPVCHKEVLDEMN